MRLSSYIFIFSRRSLFLFTLKIILRITVNFTVTLFLLKTADFRVIAIPISFSYSDLAPSNPLARLTWMPYQPGRIQGNYRKTVMVSVYGKLEDKGGV